MDGDALGTLAKPMGLFALGSFAVARGHDPMGLRGAHVAGLVNLER